MLGVAIGVAVLIVVLSVMNGFERELRSRILSVTSHATDLGVRRGAGRLAGTRANGAWKSGVSWRGAVCRGRGAADRRQIGAALGRGQRARHPAGARGPGVGGRRAAHVRHNEALRPGASDIILGAELARELEVARGDAVVLAIAQGSVTPAGVVPRLRRFEVGGCVRLGHVRDRPRRSRCVHLRRRGAAVPPRRPGDRTAARDARPVAGALVGARGRTRARRRPSTSTTGPTATRTSSVRSSSPSG